MKSAQFTKYRGIKPQELKKKKKKSLVSNTVKSLTLVNMGSPSTTPCVLFLISIHGVPIIAPKELLCSEDIRI